MKPFASLLAALLVPLTAGAAVTVQFVGLSATALSADGYVVVGLASEGGYRFHAPSDTYAALAFSPTSVNRDGTEIVGIAFGPNQAMRWQSGVTSPFASIPTPVGALYRAADAPVYTGYSFGPGGITFVSDGTTTQPLADVGPGGEPVGLSYDGTRIVGSDINGAFVVDHGTLSRMPEGTLVSIADITGDGSTLIGTAAVASGGGPAYYDSAGLHLMPVPPELASRDNVWLTATNRDARVIAGEYPGSFDFTPFLWTRQSGIVPLSELASEPPGWFFDHINAISADGSVIVGDAFTYDGLQSRGFIISGLTGFVPVPEPSTYAFYALCSLGAAILWRRFAR